MYNYNYFETSVQTEWTIYKFSEDFWLIVFVKIYIDENAGQCLETARENSNWTSKFKQARRF